MPTVVFIDPFGRAHTAAALDGGGLARLCDEVDSPVPFHCRRGTCGTCRVEVLKGADELLPPQAGELQLLALLGLSPERHRLACQAQMRPGWASLELRPLGRKAPKLRSVRVPIVHAAGAMRVLAQDTGAGEILVTGAEEITAGAVVLLDFTQPDTPRARQVMARIAGVESISPAAAGGLRLMTTVELLEHDDFLVSLFPPA